MTWEESDTWSDIVELLNVLRGVSKADGCRPCACETETTNARSSSSTQSWRINSSPANLFQVKVNIQEKKAKMDSPTASFRIVDLQVQFGYLETLHNGSSGCIHLTSINLFVSLSSCNVNLRFISTFRVAITYEIWALMNNRDSYLRVCCPWSVGTEQLELGSDCPDLEYV